MALLQNNHTYYVLKPVGANWHNKCLRYFILLNSEQVMI